MSKCIANCDNEALDSAAVCEFHLTHPSHMKDNQSSGQTVRNILLRYPATMNGTEKGHSGYTLDEAEAAINALIAKNGEIGVKSAATYWENKYNRLKNRRNAHIVSVLEELKERRFPSLHVANLKDKVIYTEKPEDAIYITDINAAISRYKGDSDEAA